MLKKTLCLALLSVASFGFAQNLDLPMDYMQNNVTGKNNLPSNVQGSPFFNDAFLYGTVFVKDDSYNAEMRYNAYLDEVQAKSKGEVISLLKRDYVKAEIAGQLYVISDYEQNGNKKQGYFVELNAGDTRLLLRQTKKFVEEKKADSSYKSDEPAKFVDEKEYYLAKKDMPATKVRLKKKEILNLLNNDTAKEYVAKNKLKLNKEASIIQFLNYYNTL